MLCPFCHSSKTSVIDKRDLESVSVSRRRRVCLKCHRRFTTYERVEEGDLFVIKKDGRREIFDRMKLRSGIAKAVEKRPVSQDTVETTVNQIELILRGRGKNEVASKIIGDLVIRKLKKIDPIAFVRFASVYKEFRSVGDFRKELKELRK